MGTELGSETKVLLDIHEAAAFLGIQKTKAYEMAAGGQLPVVRIGRLIRIHRPSLEAQIAAEAAGAIQPRRTHYGS